MADSTVGLQQATTPDRYVDNATYTNNDGTTVHRQRIEDPEVMALLRELLDALGRFGIAFDSSGRLRVLVDPIGGTQSVPVSGSLTTVSTVSTVTAVTAVTGVRRLGDDSTGVGYPAQMLVNSLAAQQRGYGVTVV